MLFAQSISEAVGRVANGYFFDPAQRAEGRTPESAACTRTRDCSLYTVQAAFPIRLYGFKICTICAYCFGLPATISCWYRKFESPV